MATIKISDLHPTGTELFSDCESYMNELSDGEIDIINGASIGGIIRSAVAASKAVSRGAKAAYSVAARQTPRLTDIDPGSGTPGGFFS